MYRKKRIDRTVAKSRRGFTGFTLVLLFLFAGPRLMSQAADSGTSRDNPSFLTGLETEMAWKSTGEEIVRLRAMCWSQSAGVARARVPDAMEALGAPREAIVLARTIGDGRYLRYIDSTTVPQRAVLHAPMGASDAHTLYLLGTGGSIINVDNDLSQLRMQARRDAGWKELAGRYPAIAIHPADRSPSHLPRIERLPAGRARVIVQYRLTDGCRACARIGYAEAAFYFDGEGSFIAQKFLGVYRQPPARPPGVPADCDR